MNRFIFKQRVKPSDAGSIADFLSARTGLSKMRVKDALNKGAVWLSVEGGTRRRIRKASANLKAGSTLELYYDEALLSRKPPRAHCLADLVHYSVWNKPAGLLTQGTHYGDHCSLLRQAELYFTPRREVYPVHRLDREARGLLLAAHSKKAASRLSAMFRENRVMKAYRVEVLGDLSGETGGVIELPLDEKRAVTSYTAVSYDPSGNVSVLDVVIGTGRLHQIRRHFDMIGHPVMGDPKYGAGNKNAEGLKVAAVKLEFRCPFQGKTVSFSVESH